LVVLLLISHLLATQKLTTTEELSQMNKNVVNALNAKDAVASANCYTEDATVLPPNKGPVKGQANIRAQTIIRHGTSQTITADFYEAASRLENTLVWYIGYFYRKHNSYFSF
jgi:hypothetical protein